MQLYARAKPKFHHMYHLHETIERFCRVLLCFVTERKHRLTKQASLHVFRHLGGTVLRDLLNRMCESFITDECLFKPLFLISPQRVVGNIGLKRADNAVLSCGALKKGDVVYAITASRVVGRIQRFWEYGSCICVPLESYRTHNNDSRCWSTVAPVIMFVGANSIVDAVPWRRHSDDIIRIVPPSVA